MSTNSGLTVASEEFIREKFEMLMERIIELERKISAKENQRPEFYRNKDLKEIFKFSDNTIIKYREDGTLPYTVLGDIYLYPVDKLFKKLIFFNCDRY